MLIGDSICLGPILQGDAPLLFNWRNTAEIARRNGPYRPTDQFGFDGWLTGLANDPSRVVFAIRDKADMRLMGYVQITNIMPTPRSGELGILIGADGDRGKGVGRQAVELAIGFAWRDLNLQRLTLFVVGDNPRAVRAYERAGFEVEGVLRRGSYIDGEHRDVTIMGVLRPAAEL